MIERIPPVILVAIGGIFGAISRYYLTGFISDYKGLPLGTLVVNVLGSFFLGWLMTYAKFGAINHSYIALLGIGFFGSFTTMSSFSVETMFLTDKSVFLGAVNVFIMLIGVLLGAFLGRIVGIILFTRLI